MLDNTEPTDNTGNSATDGPADGQTASAKKTARKAPAKRAPRKTAAKKVAESAAVENVELPAAEPVAPDTAPSADASGGTPAPAKKATRPRKAAAKKVLPAAETPTDVPAPAELPAAVTEPLTEAPAGAVADGAPAPAKKTTRKRVSKKAAAEAARPSEQPATESEPAPAPVLVPPVVLFQAPSETVVTPPSRRRRSARPVLAEPPVEPVEELEPTDEPEPVDEPDDADDDTDADADSATGSDAGRRRRRRGRRGRGSRSGESAGDGNEDLPAEIVAEVEEDDETDDSDGDHPDEVAEAALSASARRRRRRRRSSGADGAEGAVAEDDPPNTVVHVRDTNRGSGGGARGGAADDDGVRGVKGSTRLEAKRQRRRDNRDSGRRRAPILTEAEFLARRESVDRVMAVRQTGDRTQIAVLEDDILVEHYVTRASASSAVGNVYLGRVQNVLPSMEAAFIDVGRGRNGVLYAGEVNWDTAGLEGKARSIENALNSGDTVLVQVTKDPIGHKGARLTSQISLPGRFVVYVPGGGMTGISRKLLDTERSRLKAILKKVVPDEAGVIVRTAAEGASEADLINDVERLKTEWEAISRKTEKAMASGDGPLLMHGEPDLAIRVVRDIFNDDFKKLIVSGTEMHRTLTDYVADIAPELADRISMHTSDTDLFRALRVDEQLTKALDRKVWLPSGGSLVIDRTEAMTVVDVNTGKYTGSGGNLEQTVTRNNLEAAEEVVRQLRLRDIGGIVVIDFIDMVLESNRELVLRRLTECLGRDRTKHQVAEVTSLGLVQMTRKRVGEGLLEAFSEPCQHCNGRGVIVHLDPVEKKSANQGSSQQPAEDDRPTRGKRTRKAKAEPAVQQQPDAAELAAENEKRRVAATAVAAIAAATAHHDDQGAGAELLSSGSSNEHGGANGQNGVAQSGSAEQSSSAEQGGSTGQPAAAAEEAPAKSAPARPRRRRAASRPAGPPVTSSPGAAG
jgi:ribonuclease E